MNMRYFLYNDIHLVLRIIYKKHVSFLRPPQLAHTHTISGLAPAIVEACNTFSVNVF